jgi:hypothetical protein
MGKLQFWARLVLSRTDLEASFNENWATNRIFTCLDNSSISQKLEEDVMGVSTVELVSYQQGEYLIIRKTLGVKEKSSQS